MDLNINRVFIEKQLKHTKMSRKSASVPVDLHLYPAPNARELLDFSPNCGELNFAMNIWLAVNISPLEYKQAWTSQRMWDPPFLASLPTVPGDHPWPANPSNKNFRTRFRRQLRHIVGMNIALPRSIKVCIHQVWPDIAQAVDSYESPKLCFNPDHMSHTPIGNLHLSRLDDRAYPPRGHSSTSPIIISDSEDEAP